MKLNISISKYISAGAKIDNIDPSTVTVNYDKYRNRIVKGIVFSHSHPESHKDIFGVTFKNSENNSTLVYLVETYITVNVEVNLDNKYFR